MLPGPVGSDPRDLNDQADGRGIFFAAHEGVTGLELHQFPVDLFSDGLGGWQHRQLGLILVGSASRSTPGRPRPASR